jgi:RsiW-degrading membrane proteinase PrsW (M82 family)
MINIFIYILFVVCPVILWVWFFRYKDRWEPEPFALLIKLIIFGGILAAGFALVFEIVISDLLIGDYTLDMYARDSSTLQVSFGIFLFSIFVAVAIEEIAKYLFLTHKIYFAPSFNQIKDGVIYGVSLGLGLGFFENTLYFFDLLSAGGNTIDLTMLAIARAIGPMTMHIVTTGIVGLYVGKKKFSKEHKFNNIIKGLGLAIAVHFVYNILLVVYDNFLLGIIIVLGGGVFLLREIAKDENRMTWKLIKFNSKD